MSSDPDEVRGYILLNIPRPGLQTGRLASAKAPRENKACLRSGNKSSMIGAENEVGNREGAGSHGVFWANVRSEAWFSV